MIASQSVISSLAVLVGAAPSRRADNQNLVFRARQARLCRAIRVVSPLAGRSAARQELSCAEAPYFAEQISSFSRLPFASSSGCRASWIIAGPFNPAGTSSTTTSWTGRRAPDS